MCTCVFILHVCVLLTCLICLDTLELKLRMVVSCRAVLGIELRFSEWAASDFNQ